MYTLNNLVIVHCVLQEGEERQTAGGDGRRDHFGSKEEARGKRARISKAKAEQQKKGQSLHCSHSSKQRVKQRGVIYFIYLCQWWVLLFLSFTHCSDLCCSLQEEQWQESERQVEQQIQNGLK